MRLALVWFLTLATLVTASGTADASGAYDRLQSLARAQTFAWAREHPLDATAWGLTAEDGNLALPSEGRRDRDLAQIRLWRAQVDAVSLASATLVERDDAALLRSGLIARERALTVYRIDRKDYSARGRAIVDALFTQFSHLPAAGRQAGPTARAAAWRKIVSRMQRAPDYIRAAEALVTEPCALFGRFGLEQLEGAPDFLGGALTTAAKEQLEPRDLNAFVRARDALLATLRRSTAYIKAHQSHWSPNGYVIGRTAYDAMLRDEHLLPFDSADVRRMGYDELAHGWAEQTWYENAAALDHTRLGPSTGGGLAPSGSALVPYYRERLAELTDFVRSHRIVTIPDWLGTVQVVETPKYLQPVQPGASMNPPRIFGTENAGFYFITPPATSFADAARHLDLFTDFDKDRILSTAAHEVMPGHYLQYSIARRHPDFIRRIQSSDDFAEGWAYYGEEMLTQLGLYGADLDPRLDVAQWERIRGARAIVDVGLATGDLDFDAGVTFFAQQTGSTRSEAESEVASFAQDPVYVISYTVGRYQLERLLGQYRVRMGSRASLLDFHTRLLCYGTTPYAIVGPELLADLQKPLAAVRAAADY